MNLLKMRQAVRYAIDGIDDPFWSDAEINSYLNEGAKLLVADAQPLQGFFQKALTANTQEYVLPPDFDEVYTVNYHDGSSLFELTPTSPDAVQFSSAVTGRPSMYYLKQHVHETTMQSTSDGGLDAADLGFGPNAGRSVIGLHPIPSASTYTLNVFYYPRHFEMVQDADVSPIDPAYHRGIVAYAVALCKQKDEALGEMNIYLEMFNQFKERLRKKSINRGVAKFDKVVCADEVAGLGDDVIFLPDTVS